MVSVGTVPERSTLDESVLQGLSGDGSVGDNLLGQVPSDGIHSLIQEAAGLVDEGHNVFEFIIVLLELVDLVGEAVNFPFECSDIGLELQSHLFQIRGSIFQSGDFGAQLTILNRQAVNFRGEIFDLTIQSINGVVQIIVQPLEDVVLIGLYSRNNVFG